MDLGWSRFHQSNLFVAQTILYDPLVLRVLAQNYSPQSKHKKKTHTTRDKIT